MLDLSGYVAYDPTGTSRYVQQVGERWVLSVEIQPRMLRGRVDECRSSYMQEGGRFATTNGQVCTYQ